MSALALAGRVMQLTWERDLTRQLAERQHSQAFIWKQQAELRVLLLLRTGPPLGCLLEVALDDLEQANKALIAATHAIENPTVA